MLFPACILTPEPGHIQLSGTHFLRDPLAVIEPGVLPCLHKPSPYADQLRFEDALLSDTVAKGAAGAFRKLRAA